MESTKNALPTSITTATIAAESDFASAVIRPALVSHGSSDSSVNTLASFASNSTDSSDGMLYHHNLVVPVTHSPAIHPLLEVGEASDRLEGSFGNLKLEDTGKQQQYVDENCLDLRESAPPHGVVGPIPGPTAWRHQNLPSLITDAERAMQNIRTSAAQTTYVPPTTSVEGSPRGMLSSASHAPSTSVSSSGSSPTSPALARSIPGSSPYPYLVSPVISSTSSALKRSTASEQTTSAAGAYDTALARTTSQSPSFARLPSPTAIPRPGSAGTFSSGNSISTGSSSCRPWVRDSDASSICSATSSCWSSSSNQKKDDEDDPEVFKVEDGFDFLDPRPEPSGVKLTINREDPTLVVVQVTLPGFALENITVAMRRGNKVHVVADSYDTVNGGHFEKLISLGCDVSSAGPRAEFNGTTLNVFIQRRVARSKNSKNSRRNTSPPMSPPISSPASSIASPELDGQLSSYFSAHGSGEGQAEEGADQVVPSPPIVTRSTAEFAGKNGNPAKSTRCWTGPEGARAAAKAAREEAARRAKEAAKSLTKGGRSAPFRREEKSAVAQDIAPTENLPTPPGRSGTIRGRTPSPQPSALSPAMLDHSGTTDDLPTRPKFRGSNLTLRAGDRTSFVEAALAAAAAADRDPEGLSPGDVEGGRTPRVERDSMSFTATT